MRPAVGHNIPIRSRAATVAAFVGCLGGHRGAHPRLRAARHLDSVTLTCCVPPGSAAESSSRSVS